MQESANVQDMAGRTPLHEAAENGHLDTVKRLVNSGANLYTMDNDGKTAFDLGKNHIDVASYLGLRMTQKFLEEKKFDDALKMYGVLLKIQEEKLGSGHSETIKCRRNIEAVQVLLRALGRSVSSFIATNSK